MFERKNAKYNDIVLNLQGELGKLEKELQLSIQNKDKVESANKSLEANLIVLKALETAEMRLDSLVHYVDNYIEQRNKLVDATIANTFRIASEIVPDSDDKIFLDLDHVSKTSTVTTREGLMVSETEGSGYQSVLSAFLQTRILMMNKSLLQFIMLDEPFAKVSAENTSVLAPYLNLLSKEIQIILTEQKRNVLPNDVKVFNFFKLEDRTIVEEV